MSRTAGFTLVELLLAVALTTTVMASAFAAADLFARADRLVIEDDERGVDVDRALRFLREDVLDAKSLTLTADQVTIERCNGRHVGWVSLGTGVELHRIECATAPELATAAARAVATGAVAVERDSRGHLPDSSWRETAVIQGEFTFVTNVIKSPLDGATIGLAAQFTWGAGDVRRQRTATTCALALAEAHAKPTTGFVQVVAEDAAAAAAAAKNAASTQASKTTTSSSSR